MDIWNNWTWKTIIKLAQSHSSAYNLSLVTKLLQQILAKNLFEAKDLQSDYLIAGELEKTKRRNH